MKKIGAVILAAGLASRMGQQKLLLPLGGKPLLAHALTTVMKLRLDSVIAVIGEPQQQLANLCQEYGISSIYNSNRLSGQATSVKLGLSHVADDVDGILFLPGDQPLVPLALLQAMVKCFARETDNSKIVVPLYKGEYRSPVLFGADWRQHLTELKGDQGGRSVVKQYPEQVATVEWPDEQAFWDADTWEDYQCLVRYLR